VVDWLLLLPIYNTEPCMGILWALLSPISACSHTRPFKVLADSGVSSL